MSSTISSSSDLLTAAEAAAKKAQATNAAASTSSTSGSTSGDALSSLSSNYNQFLSLLTAQLQHQEPTSPMDTSELAQFAGVEQQINTNTNLTQLLSLNQDSEVSQSTSLVGRQAVVSSSQLPLQNGSAEVRLNPTTSGTVDLAITNSAGTVVKTQTLNLNAGTTDWSWNGQDDSGNQLADGNYNVAVVSASDGTSVPVPFSVLGTITGVTKDGTTGVDIQMGSSSTNMSNVTSLLGTATAASTGSGSSSTGS